MNIPVIDRDFNYDIYIVHGYLKEKISYDFNLKQHMELRDI
jgi:hypothetical protein